MNQSTKPYPKFSTSQSDTSSQLHHLVSEGDFEFIMILSVILPTTLFSLREFQIHIDQLNSTGIGLL
jgi:hypothetical protein